MATIGWAAGVPEPSRRPCSSGRSTGAPLAAAAFGGAGADAGDEQRVLALEEAVAADAAGAAALGGVLRERRDLDRARLGAGQRVGRARHRRHDVVGGGVDRAEVQHRGARCQPDAGDAAAGATLRPDAGGGEVQQLRVGA